MSRWCTPDTSSVCHLRLVAGVALVKAARVWHEGGQAVSGNFVQYGDHGWRGESSGTKKKRVKTLFVPGLQIHASVLNGRSSTAVFVGFGIVCVVASWNMSVFYLCPGAACLVESVSTALDFAICASRKAIRWVWLRSFVFFVVRGWFFSRRQYLKTSRPPARPPTRPPTHGHRTPTPLRSAVQDDREAQQILDDLRDVRRPRPAPGDREHSERAGQAHSVSPARDGGSVCLDPDVQRAHYLCSSSAAAEACA